MNEQVFISKGREMIFRFTCKEKGITCRDIMKNEEGILFEVMLTTASQLFYLGREYQINLQNKGNFER